MNAPPASTTARQEKIARLLLACAITGLLIAVVAFQRAALQGGPERVFELRARMPEAGGWLPESLTAQVGEPLRLRLTSDDVVHGFAIGHADQPPVDIFPGQVSEVSLIFNQPGKYTFYCTRWCGANHWRMRGVIEVSGEGQPLRSAEQPPYIILGIDIDAPHPAQVTPAVKPQATQAVELLSEIPRSYLAQEYYRSHSPAETWLALRGEPALSFRSDDEIWNLVGWIWRTNTTPEALAEGQKLYAENCAACHGEAGAGDGVFAGAPASSTEPHDGEGPLTGHGIQPPTSFQDIQAMFGASPALLHGKIVRGGMGTGMPYWGPVFTDEQVWALVAYLYAYHIEE